MPAINVIIVAAGNQLDTALDLKSGAKALETKQVMKASEAFAASIVKLGAARDPAMLANLISLEVT